MKYSKHIVFFLFINLVIVFLAIFLGNLTRKLEINNNLVEKNIQKEKEQLKVNKIEYSFYNNPNRVWVHTCSLDHKNALNNYISRGMKVFKTEILNF